MHLFTYGSLMLPSVMHAVTGRRFAAESAVLHGYARYCVKNATYPGLVEQAGARTDGMVYRDVDADALSRLDAFEGSTYQRLPVTVKLEDTTRLPANTYVVRPTHQACLSDEPWHLDTFRQHHLDAFLASYQGFSALK